MGKNKKNNTKSVPSAGLPRAKKMLFVRGLAPATTDTDLEQHFTGKGLSVKRAFLVKRAGQPTGVGFVQLEADADADAAASSAMRSRLHGRRLQVERAVRRDKREPRKKPQSAKSKNSGSGGSGGGAAWWDDEPHPPASTGPDADADDSEASASGGAEGDEASDRDDGDDGDDGEGGDDDDDGDDSGKEAAAESTGKKYAREQRRERRREQQHRRSAKKARVVMRNVPFEADRSDIERVFATVGSVVDCVLPKKADGRAGGFAFVQMGTAKEAAEAVERLNGGRLGGRVVAVDWAVPKRVYDDNDNDNDNDNGNDNGNDNDGSGRNGGDAMDVDGQQSRHRVEQSQRGGEHGGGDEQSGSLHAQQHPERRDRPPRRQRGKDSDDGRTLFVRNLPFDATEEQLRECFGVFGDIEYALLVIDKATGRPKGTGFVRFSEMDSADAALAEARRGLDSDSESDDDDDDDNNNNSNNNDDTGDSDVKGGTMPGSIKGTKRERESKARRRAGDLIARLATSNIVLNQRPLLVTRAIDRKKATALEQEHADERQGRDRRNLYLAREGVILAGSPAAEGLSKSDLEKRQQAYALLKKRLTNPNMSVSRTRLSVRNLPKGVTEREMGKVFGQFAPGGLDDVVQCKLERDKGKGGRSRGFGFVEYVSHDQALRALRAVNNNPHLLGTPDKRPIVSFAVQDARVMQQLAHRQSQRHRQQQMQRQAAAVAAGGSAAGGRSYLGKRQGGQGAESEQGAGPGAGPKPKRARHSQQRLRQREQRERHERQQKRFERTVQEERKKQQKRGEVDPEIAAALGGGRGAAALSKTQGKKAKKALKRKKEGEQFDDMVEAWRNRFAK